MLLYVTIKSIHKKIYSNSISLEYLKHQMFVYENLKLPNFSFNDRSGGKRFFLWKVIGYAKFNLNIIYDINNIFQMVNRR